MDAKPVVLAPVKPAMVTSSLRDLILSVRPGPAGRMIEGTRRVGMEGDRAHLKLISEIAARLAEENAIDPEP